MNTIIPDNVFWYLADNLFLFVGIAMLVWSVLAFPGENETPIDRQIAKALGQGDRDTIFEIKAIAPFTGISLAIAHHVNVPAVRSTIRTNLIASGNAYGYTVNEYIALCVLCGMGFGIFSMILAAVIFGALNPLIPIVASICGFFAPAFALSEAARGRCSRISKRLPYTLDLIALTMAAGSNFTEAVQTIVRDDPESDLNQELGIVQSEIEFGMTRAQALTNMADRLPIEQLRSVIGAVNQAELLGTSLSTILKNQATMLRNGRSVIAEKRSASASLRILIPSMLIMAAVLLCVFGPYIIRFAKGQLTIGN
jgi:tight adherence protein C